MRFTVLAAPGSDPGAARARASHVVTVANAHDVAVAASRCDDPYLLLLGPGARPLPAAFGGLTAAFDDTLGVLGGATHGATTRMFGWMLAPAPGGPLPFELAAVSAPLSEPGIDAMVRGPIDVVAPGMLIAARELLLEPLPAEPVAALIELCARARAAGRTVICRPAFACEGPPLDADDRGRVPALRETARRHPELTATHLLPCGARRVAVEREIRFEGGQRVRARVARPALTVLVHGSGAQLAARRVRDLAPNATARVVDDPVSALRDELRVRGDRYVLVVDAAHLPDAGGVDALIERIEEAPFVAIAAPSADDLVGRCVLLHAGRFPQHVEPVGATLAEAIGSLVDAAHVLRRAVRAPGYVPPPIAGANAALQHRATILFLTSSLPEVTRMTLDAVFAAVRPGDEIAGVCASNAETAQRMLAAYPQVRVETDAGDPLLTSATNRAIGAASNELIAVVADDVLLPAGALERLRDAFVRLPALGAAFAAVPGAAGGEGVLDAAYGDIGTMRALAERRERERAREIEPIDLAVTPAFVVARAAFHAVGGIDPADGPTARGIAGLVARLRTAGYLVVRCDDALVHRFDPEYSRNPAASASGRLGVPLALAGAALARGFDPATRVPFVRDAEPSLATAASHAIAVPVGDTAELECAAAFLRAATDAFDANSPVRVHLLLDGSAEAADVVARIRPILAGSGKPMDATLTVRIERTADLGRWLEAQHAGVRVVVAAAHPRDAFAGLRRVAAHDLRTLLEPVTR